MARYALRSTILPGLAALLGACDVLSPEPAFTIDIEANAARGVLRSEGGRQLIECTVALEARASGGGRSHAVWKEGVFRFHVLGGEGAPFDSVRFSEADVQEEWGSSTIGKKQTQNSTWIMWATVPFSIAGEMQYTLTSGRELRSAPFSFDCGPQLPPGSGAKPEIRDLQLSPLTGDLQPLDSLTVTYTATSSIGLWSTAVIVSGAYEQVLEFPEQLQTTTTRTVHLVVPTATPLGQRVEVRVVAFDAKLQGAESPTRITTPLVDHTPPVADFWIAGDAPSCIAAPCQFAVGDPLPLHLSASDNHLLAWMVYEVGQPVITRDSIPLSGAMHAGPVGIPTRAEWVGTPAIRFYVRDQSGNTSREMSIPAGKVHLYPTVQRPLHMTTVEGEHTDLQIDSRRRVLYLTQPGRREILTFSLPALGAGTRIPLPAEPAGLDLSLSGDSLLVALPALKAIGVVDLTDVARPVALVPITAMDTAPPPRSVRVAANGRWLVTMQGYPRTAQLVVIDPADDTQSVRPVSGRAYSDGRIELLLSGDRSRVLVTREDGCAYIYDVARDVLGPCAELVERFYEVAVDFTGSLYASRRAIYDGAFQSIRFQGPSRSTAIGVAPDGQRIYAADDGGVHVKRAGDGTAIERIPAPLLLDRLYSTDDGALLVGVKRAWSGSTMHTRLDVVELR